MIFAGGHISGGHFNPAVTLAVFLRGRLDAADVLPYWSHSCRGLAAAWSGPLRRSPGSLDRCGATGRNLAAADHRRAALHVRAGLRGAQRGDQQGPPGQLLLRAGDRLHRAGRRDRGRRHLGRRVQPGGRPGRRASPALAGWSMIWVYVVATLAGGALAAVAFRALNPDDVTGPIVPAGIPGVTAKQTVPTSRRRLLLIPGPGPGPEPLRAWAVGSGAGRPWGAAGRPWGPPAGLGVRWLALGSAGPALVGRLCASRAWVVRRRPAPRSGRVSRPWRWRTVSATASRRPGRRVPGRTA